MITDDEVMRLFERADPARVDDAAAVADPRLDLATLRTRSNNVTLIDTEPTPTRPRRRRWPVAAAAAAAAVAIGIGGLVLASRDDDAGEPRVPAAPPTDPPGTEAAEAERVAREFLDAYVGFDADRAITYLTDDALAEDFESQETMRLELALYEAQPFEQRILDCEQQADSAAGISVRCPFDFHFLRSDEIGRGPFGDNYWDLTVRDGMIVSADLTLPFMTNGMSSQMWVPFANWIATNHPDDVLTMYEDSSRTSVRLTEESVARWEQRSREFVAAVLTGPEAYVAAVGAICATQAAELAALTMPAEIGPDQGAAWRSTAAIMEQAHSQLTALDQPPATDLVAYTAFYGRLAQLVRIAEESAEAATAGDSTRLAELDAEYLDARRRMSSGPAGSGLAECEASLPG